MATNLKYIPVFRTRQQEILVLSTFEFEKRIFPLIEIIKEKDRANSTATFVECYQKIITSIKAEKVFVDLPIYLKESGSMQDEVLAFSRSIISNKENRTQRLIDIGKMNNKVIPVISSYVSKTGEADTLKPQFDLLVPHFDSIAIRMFIPSFDTDLPEVTRLLRASDYLIIDLDTITPNTKTPVFKKLIEKLNAITICPKIILKSAINSDIQNTLMEHGSIIYEADNSQIETYRDFGAIAFGDYVGIKKDDLTAGGTISPGFIFYDATENSFYGFKGLGKDDRTLADFENIIVPAVIESAAAKRMAPPLLYLSDENKGWQTINKISRKEESGKSQAKFKRIAMEHYLHCIRTNIRGGEYDDKTV
ncbi:MAG TPA: hypothetical protein VK750_09445 [Cytophagaceae bacterium]|jgi:hypothetical protein|nr:hypothetical protein [Cytophagaceae bacterium]